MRKKSEFTIFERALQTVPGFDKVYQEVKQQTILGGRIQCSNCNTGLQPDQEITTSIQHKMVHSAD